MSKVLLVTDSDWVANDVESSLATGEWELTRLSDPRAAAQGAEDEGSDVVLVDMQIGSMGGMAVIRDLRAHFQHSQPPRTVLLLDREADRFLARRARADAAVIKPVVASVLRDAIG